jgi:DNA-binding transcriptional MerR regulator
MKPTPSDDFGPHEVYTIETVEKITRISRDRIVLYYQHGLVSPARKTETEILFDEQGVLRLRRIAFVLSEYGINHQGLKEFISLMDEVEKLREELRFLRGR